MFSCEFCDVFKNNSFYKTPPVAAFDKNLFNNVWHFNEHQALKGYTPNVIVK